MRYKKILPILLSGTMFLSAVPCEPIFAETATEDVQVSASNLSSNEQMNIGENDQVNVEDTENENASSGTSDAYESGKNPDLSVDSEHSTDSTEQETVESDADTGANHQVNVEDPENKIIPSGTSDATEEVNTEGNTEANTEGNTEDNKEEKQDVITITGSNGTRTLTLTNPSQDYPDLQVAVWSKEGGQDDLGWYNLTKQPDGSWKTEIDAGAIKHSGDALLHVYTGKKTFIGAVEEAFAEDEVAAEKVEVLGTGSKRNVVVKTVKTYSSMKVAVWSSEGGQDDLKWYTLTKQSDGTWKTSVDLHALKHSGKAHFHVYGTTKSSVFVTSTTAVFSEYEVLGYSISTEKNGTKEHVVVKTSSSYKTMKAAVWSATGGQDDLKWYTMTKQSDGTWTCDLAYSNLKHDGTVYIHVYADSSTFIGAKSITVEKEVPKLESVSVSDIGDKRSVSVITDDVACDSMRIAVWSATGGQDDLKWYTMQRLATENNSWDGTISIANIKHSGNVVIHVYVDSSTYIGSSSFTLTDEELVTDQVNISEKDGMKTITVTPVNTYSGMSVAVWSKEGGQDDLRWLDLKKNADGTWSVSFYPGWLKHSGECNAHVYASGSKFIKAAKFTVDENAIKTNWVSVSGTGTTRKITAFSAKSCTKMRVAVWSSEGGQDDIKWTTMKKNPDNTWSVTISTGDLKHYGKCYAHVYADTSTFVGAFTFEVDKKDMPKNTVSVTGTGAYKTIKLNNPASSFSKVKVAVWSATSGQDDLTWNSLKKGTDGTWSLQYPLSSLRHSGTCYAHVYADDVLVGSKNFNVSDADYFNALLTYKQPYDPYGKGGDIDYVRCAINIAKNDTIGYGHTWPATISCAGLVGLALTYCGYGDFIKNDPLQWGYIDLGPEYEAELINKVGCQVLQGPWNRSNYTQLLPGDIVYYYYSNSYNHAGIYIGNGYLVEARGSSGPTDRDDNGAEVAVYYWPNDPIQFQKVFRIPADKIHYLS